VASLLCHFLCWITVVIAATGVLIGFSISAAERVVHYAHPRPVVERNDKELRVVPKNHGSPAKNKEARHIDKKGALTRGTNGGY
jgi:cell division protein FtsN